MAKLLLRLLMAVCVLIGAFCPFGFWSAFEPGKERFLIIYPAVFVAAAVVGTITENFARR